MRINDQARWPGSINKLLNRTLSVTAPRFLFDRAIVFAKN
jgi:hypothetical protein